MVLTHRSGDFLRAWVSTSALFLSGLFLPVGGVFLMMFTPQPGLRLEQSSGMRPLLALVPVVALTAGIVAGPLAGAFYLSGFALLTVLLSLTLRQSWSLEVSVVVGTFVLLIALTVVAMSLGDSPADLLVGFQKLLEQSREVLLTTYGDSDPDRFKQIGEVTAAFIRFVVGIAPALIVIALGVTVLLNLLVIRWRQPAASSIDLMSWSAPEPLVWVLIFSGYLSFLPEPVVQSIGWNVFIVVLSIYFLHGLAIIGFLFRKWQTPSWVRILVYTMFVFEWILAAGVAVLGIFDLWADFRRPRLRPEDGEEFEDD